ncbi:MAG: bifunctional riboflavin kinase/FAD synthetase [Desulfobacterota bacterium]|nr:bifunctional riboflavin kinase/FAD synthetase [Thermodesulfobacteriota bacterium]
MEIIRGIDNLRKPLKNPVVTLGNFDGVHLGHQRIFEKVKAEARRVGGESMVITFEPHPLKILSPNQCPPLLTPFRKKMWLLEKTGVEKVLCIHFTQAFSELSPFEFVKNILVDQVGAQKVYIGYNYRFGKGKAGDATALKEICGQFGVEVEVVEALTVGEIVVSSSKIRELIKEGDVKRAASLLGRPYPVFGRVIEGAKRGHLLGFPTANLEMGEELYPKPGVYAVRVAWQGKEFKGVANMGFNPTFEANALSLEIHLLNFQGDLYGEELQVSFVERIRDEIRFPSTEALITQIKNDIAWAERNVFGINGSISRTSPI